VPGDEWLFFLGKLAPQLYRSTNRQFSVAEPEVWFRIVHLTPEDGVILRSSKLSVAKFLHLVAYGSIMGVLG